MRPFDTVRFTTYSIPRESKIVGVVQGPGRDGSALVRHSAGNESNINPDKIEVIGDISSLDNADLRDIIVNRVYVARALSIIDKLYEISRELGEFDQKSGRYTYYAGEYLVTSYDEGGLDVRRVKDGKTLLELCSEFNGHRDSFIIPGEWIDSVLARYSEIKAIEAKRNQEALAAERAALLAMIG